MTRIAFDLRDESSPQVLAALRAALDDAIGHGHEPWLAFEIADAPRRDALVRLCDGVVAPERLVGYELPAGNDKLRSAVRDAFFDALDVDRVLAAPAWTEVASAATRPPIPKRSRLALVSPFPPQQSGVAFHAADLAGVLQRDHDLELVTPQASLDDPRLAGMPLRSPEWFGAHADEFDEVIYQVGNSWMHEFVFDLLEQHPGVVVLHDVFLSNVIHEMEHRGSRPQGLVRALYGSHGWPAVADHARSGLEAAVWKYPASAGVLARATRVIVHSQHARELIERWWGPALAARCTVVPLLREFGPTPSRAQARARLGIGDDDFLVCSFGMLGPIKCNQELLQAFFESGLADDRRCSLVFVGENLPSAYGDALALAVTSHRRAAQVRITGFVSAQDYALYLAACDVAVQLRRRSRGETSAAVLDCLGHGVPTIVNAHGSSAELAEDLVVKLADEFTTTELAGALERLRADASLRQRLSRAASHVVDLHSADAVAAGYRDAIAHARRSPVAAYRRFLRNAAPMIGAASRESLEAIAACVDANQPSARPRQMLVDVSAIVIDDLGTGIQRVVRELLRVWFVSPPAGWRVEPVYSPGPGQPWRYARRYAAALAGARPMLDDAVAELRSGDVFVGLDLYPWLIGHNEPLLLAMRERGVRIVFTVYDLLPVRLRHAFPAEAVLFFETWLRTVMRVADRVVAISQASALDFADWIAANPPQRSSPVDIAFFRLGADLPKSVPPRLAWRDRWRKAWRDAWAVRKATWRPALLMVGTIEPRKGHAQALAAVELLWARGVNVNLVVVGKAGWMVDPLVARLESHPQRGRRLFWFGHTSDAQLAALYERSAALLAASEGEGFGLPLVEGAQRGLPLIARDIAVFREVAGGHAFYFDGTTPQALADAVEQWLALRARDAHPKPEGLRRCSWQESARSFEEAALGERTISRWSP